MIDRPITCGERGVARRETHRILDSRMPRMKYLLDRYAPLCRSSLKSRGLHLLTAARTKAVGDPRTHAISADDQVWLQVALIPEKPHPREKRLLLRTASVNAYNTTPSRIFSIHPLPWTFGDNAPVRERAVRVHASRLSVVIGISP